MPGIVLRVITRLNRGGPLRQLCALVPGLVEHGWEGPVVTGPVVTGQVATGGGESDGTADLRAAGAEIVVMPSLQRGLAPGRDAQALRALSALIGRVRPDLVHTHTGKAGALGRVAAHRAGVPVIHTLHGHHFDGTAVRSLAARTAERALGRLTDAVVALSPRQARDLIHVHRVVPAERVQVIAPGMDIAGFRRRATQRPTPLGLRGERIPHFLWTGRFVAVKDPLLLVQAVARAASPLRVTMLGRGPLLESTREAIRTHSLEDRLACPGSVRDVAPWLSAAAGLVLCSRSEGMPLSVIEAMVLGKPVLVPTVGGLPDLVDHGRTGLWVPPRDPLALAGALDRLAGDRALRARLGAAGREGAEARFGAGRLARETATLYEQVAGRP